MHSEREFMQAGHPADQIEDMDDFLHGIEISDDDYEYMRGTEVSHDDYGKGTIVEVNQEKETYKVQFNEDLIDVPTLSVKIAEYDLEGMDFDVEQ